MTVWTMHDIRSSMKNVPKIFISVGHLFCKKPMLSLPNLETPTLKLTWAGLTDSYHDTGSSVVQFVQKVVL